MLVITSDPYHTYHYIYQVNRCTALFMCRSRVVFLVHSCIDLISLISLSYFICVHVPYTMHLAQACPPHPPCSRVWCLYNSLLSTFIRSIHDFRTLLYAEHWKVEGFWFDFSFSRMNVWTENFKRENILRWENILPVEMCDCGQLCVLGWGTGCRICFKEYWDSLIGTISWERLFILFPY